MDSSEGTGFEPIFVVNLWYQLTSENNEIPLFPTMYVSNPFSAKLSEWYIIRGLRPMSPRTRMATELNDARSTGCLTTFHTTKQNAARDRICRDRTVSLAILSGYHARTCPAPNNLTNSELEVKIVTPKSRSRCMTYYISVFLLALMSQ